ncbi:MAG: polysaccharide deacetylase family protein [Pseudomonadota bacterium]
MFNLTRRDVFTRGAIGLLSPLLATPAITGRALAQANDGRPAALPRDATHLASATITRVETTRPRVALTFDDGPHPSLTPQLLDILAARGARATFYVIGRNAARYPQLLQRIAAEGHEIGNHTWSHPSLYGHGEASLLNQIDRTAQVVADAVGRPPVTMRPPYGNIHPWQARALYQARGVPSILWSVDPLDWQRPGSWVVADRILRGSHNGAVILSHDIHGPTVRAMPSTIEGLAARGFEMVQVSELLGWPRWDTRRIRLAAG